MHKSAILPPLRPADRRCANNPEADNGVNVDAFKEGNRTMNAISGIQTEIRGVAGFSMTTSVVRAISGYWTAYSQRRAHNRAVAQLRAWSDSQLKDIGISRGEIEFAVTDKDGYRHIRHRAHED